jgi:hypothetical protein
MNDFYPIVEAGTGRHVGKIFVKNGVVKVICEDTEQYPPIEKYWEILAKKAVGFVNAGTRDEAQVSGVVQLSAGKDLREIADYINQNTVISDFIIDVRSDEIREQREQRIRDNAEEDSEW